MRRGAKKKSNGFSLTKMCDIRRWLCHRNKSTTQKGYDHRHGIIVNVSNMTLGFKGPRTVAWLFTHLIASITGGQWTIPSNFRAYQNRLKYFVAKNSKTCGDLVVFRARYRQPVQTTPNPYTKPRTPTEPPTHKLCVNMKFPLILQQQQQTRSNSFMQQSTRCG